MGRVETEVRHYEKAVRGWLPALDAPAANREQAVVVALGFRGRALYRGLTHACSGPTPIVAADAVLRALVDLAILIRWIERAPALHIDMWLAEDDRGRITVADKWREMHRRRGSVVSPAFTRHEVAAMRESIAKVRKAARDGGEPIGTSGAVLPTLEDMAGTTDDLFEVYQIAYRSLSPSSHSGAASFVGDSAEKRADDWHVKSASAWTPIQLRALAVSTMCFVVASVSRQLSLKLEKDADELRVAFALWRPDDRGS